MTEKNYLGLTRRPREDRYYWKTLGTERPRAWMESVLGMLEVVLDWRGNFSLQDVADALDYGPDDLSPRQQESVAEIAGAWERAKASGREQCKLGNHRFKEGRCWWCDEPKLKIVDAPPKENP